MEHYYQILGIPLGSTKSEIKKAYRKLAMRYHPDRNNGKDADHKFFQITEAYEILIGERKAPVVRTVSHHYQRQYTRRSYNFRRQSYREMWEDERDRRRREARQRAREQAKMRYENFRRNNGAFKKSWYYKPTYYLIQAIYVIGWALGIFLLFSPFFAAFYFYAQGSQWWKGLFCLPLMLAGILCIHHTQKLKQEADPFFR
ncbi:DnaJ domain-containing protein [Catalinimonas niigatensis]|uniref:DnaJ domain-containing protein n=1 Tax=Catalinimonas niigatensis TaxID=1397264 RepID=UPI002666396B|nr:DnaJ domain-containing protein [Catalinimonas niigatensis]WPP50596.1 DnaJ domain-containing protein [Catalinimonas niigatensis]